MSQDTTITVINKTPDELSFALSTSNFAWKAFALVPTTATIFAKSDVIYESTQQIRITLTETAEDGHTIGEMVIMAEAVAGDHFSFTIDSLGAMQLQQSAGDQSNAIACSNNAAVTVSAALYKSGAPMLEIAQLTPGMTVSFAVPPKVTLSWFKGQTVPQGQPIDPPAPDSRSIVLDLEHSSTLTATLISKTDGYYWETTSS